MRKSWTNEHFSFEGKYYQNAEIGFNPRPAKPIPFWYAGATPASVRRALAFCDGWFPGRITYSTYKKRVEKLRTDAPAMGRPRILEGCIPITSIDVDRKTALKKVNVDGLLHNANEQKFWVKPPSGSFKTWEDLEGSFMVGSPDDIVRDVERYLEIGSTISSSICASASTNGTTAWICSVRKSCRKSANIPDEAERISTPSGGLRRIHRKPPSPLAVFRIQRTRHQSAIEKV